MRRCSILMATLAATLVVAAPAGAITFGTVDTTNRFPYVGAVIAEYNEPGTKEVLCSGTLIAPTVFLTAGHCTAFLESIGVQDVWVTFAPSFDAASPLIHGT